MNYCEQDAVLRLIIDLQHRITFLEGEVERLRQEKQAQEKQGMVPKDA